MAKLNIQRFSPSEQLPKDLNALSRTILPSSYNSWGIFHQKYIPYSGLLNPYQLHKFGKPTQENKDPQPSKYDKQESKLDTNADWLDISKPDDGYNWFKSKQFAKKIVLPLVFRSVTSDGTPYKDINGNSNLNLPLVDILLENAIITVRQSKTIVKTKIIGRDGEVKELIGLDDYEIKIEGTITGKNGEYPKDDVINLYNYCILKSSIWVGCPYLNDLFGINYITIKDYDISQEIGSISQQKYSITAYSDQITGASIFTP
jgi:hypothetical protein